MAEEIGALRAVLALESAAFDKGVASARRQLTVLEGGFQRTGGQVVQPGGHIAVFSNDNGDDIGATNKTWDLTGTGAQTSEWTIVMG